MADQTVQEVAKTAQPAINDAVHALMAWAQQITDFGKEQAPLLAQEIIKWGIASNALETAIGLLLVIVALMLMRNKLLPAIRNWDAEDQGMAIFLFLIPLVISACVFVDGLADLLKAIVAPRLFLIEYLAHLIK